MILLGIDCGTQSTKVVALDWETGEILASGGEAYGFVEGLPEGAMEQDPAWWVAAADKGMREVLAALGPRKVDVAGIGVSGQQHGLVVLDKNDRVLRPAKLWCDTSTTAECREITSALGGDAGAVASVGNTIRPGYTAPKIRWMAHHEPDLWDRTATILLPHDFLNFWLTGEKRMEYGDASGTALLDIQNRSWAPQALDATAAGLAERLPALGSSSEPCGKLRETLCKAWGLSQAPLVSSGGGDNMMAAIGTGNVQVGEVTASLGTSGTLFAFSDKPVVDPRGEVAAFCDSTDHWLPLVCTMNLTLISEHVRKLFGWSHDEMDAMISAEKPGGLVFLPYLTGERTPDLPSARGVLANISLTNFTAGGLARAAVESVLLGLGYGLNRFRELGVPVSSIRLTGGASSSPIWRQLCADIFGVPVMALDSGKGAASGAAIQAGWAVLQAQGDHCTLPEIAQRLVTFDDSTRCQPNRELTAHYAGVLDQSRELRAALLPTSFLS
ncbi:MAG: xylulokinase [Terrimicrobiaceae bacterium]